MKMPSSKRRHSSSDATPAPWVNWVEPLTPLFLAVHGAALLADSSPTLIQSLVVALAAASGFAGLLGMRSRRAVEGRAWLLAVITWVLLYVSGGVAAFFTLWYFMLAAGYPLVIGRRAAFIYPVTIGAAYLALSPLSERALAPAVLYGRATVITAIGLVVATIATRQRKATISLLAAKDEFLASVSHELRTPLAAVVGFAAQLDQQLDELEPDEVREFASEVHRHSVEVADIVEDLLVAARVDGSGLVILETDVELHDQVVRIAGDLGPVYSLARGWLPIIGTPVTVNADMGRVRQILRNLLVNAIRYGGSNVEVRLGSDSGRGFVEVIDDGPGIPRAQAARIFTPYQRFHDNIGQPDPIGLGLAVSLSLAELMNGELSYERRNESTVFRLELPLSASAVTLETNTN